MTPPAAHAVKGYETGKEIGRGAFATVYLGHVTGRPEEQVAIKAVHRERLNKKLAVNLLNEIAILKEFRHPNIVQLLSVQQTERFIYLVMEYCQGGDLHHTLRQTTLKPLPEPLAKRIIRDIASAMKELRANNMFHRDIKPQNILLSGSLLLNEARFKLADFGFARHIRPSDMAETLCGSPLYMAPEILRYENYGPEVDLWSVGAIMYELLVGKAPFDAANHIHLAKVIERSKVHYPEPLSEDARDLLQRLLQKDPQRRCSFEAFFGHPFLTGRTRPVSIAARTDGAARAGFSLDSAPALHSTGATTPTTLSIVNRRASVSSMSGSLFAAHRADCREVRQAALLIGKHASMADAPDQRIFILERAVQLLVRDEAALSPRRAELLQSARARLGEYLRQLHRRGKYANCSEERIQAYAIRRAKDGSTQELLGRFDEARQCYEQAQMLLASNAPLAEMLSRRLSALLK